jgi:energy-coupling factor transport system permease protein
MFITALRFIPILMDEMGLILQAQMSRGYNSDTRNPLKKLTVIIPLAIPLLVSSIKKTEKTAVSMVVRGFGSGPRSHFKEISMRSADYCIFGMYAMVLAGTIVYVYC